MRVIIFSWEYPPRVVGKLANYVKELTFQLAKSEVETFLVTYHDYLTGEFEEEGVKVYRVTNPVKIHISVLTWVLTLNQEVERAAANIYYKNGEQVDLIDVQDWHFIPAAVTLKKALSIPFVYSVESLEDHRSHGVNLPFNMAIKSIEWLGMYEANIILVKSYWMASEVARIYNVPEAKVKIVNPEAKNWFKCLLKVYRGLKEA
ncbi:MAG: glycosyltransferase family 4 protein [Candidatus Bathyarchaeota archaeon]|nr:glycosyltransferase family 4 protein [Candidatus Bathyarchaeota archaeon]MDW8039826.1 glycosyltransferase family 4 protein [Nitrososphaerota archaeon]